MAGPTPNFTSPYRSTSAAAMTCAVEWRRSSKPSGLLAVTMATESPSATGASKSTAWPFTMPASAAFTRPAPMEAATSATVAPSASSLVEPSGSTMFMMVPFLRRARTKRLRDLRRGVECRSGWSSAAGASGAPADTVIRPAPPSPLQREPDTHDCLWYPGRFRLTGRSRNRLIKTKEAACSRRLPGCSQPAYWTRSSSARAARARACLGCWETA